MPNRLDYDPHIRAAIGEAQQAQAEGNPPFEAVLMHEDGTVLGRAGNTEGTTDDTTAYAETNLVRTATRQYDTDTLRQATLDAGTEPCAMCAGAIFRARIGRGVFGLRAVRHYEMTGQTGRQLHLSCREVLDRGNHPVAVLGPVLEDEAAAVFTSASR